MGLIQRKEREKEEMRSRIREAAKKLFLEKGFEKTSIRNIADEIENKLKRVVNLSAVHVTLYRLEDKGHIKSALGGGTRERGGRRKRIYSITSAGMATLKAMKDTRIDLWKMVPQLKIS